MMERRSIAEDMAQFPAEVDRICELQDIESRERTPAQKRELKRLRQQIGWTAD